MADQKKKKAAVVSINDVAKLAGVAPGTVSHALNGVGYVKEETREKVIRAVKELNYVPNRAGRILKTTKTKSIMLAIPDTSNEIYFDMIKMVLRTVKKQDYSMLLYYTGGEYEEEMKVLRMLREKVVDGLFLINFSYEPALLEEIERVQAPVVLCGMCNHLWANKGLPFDTISIDVYKGIYTAVKHLIQMGHRKIGYLAGRQGVEVYRQRFEAYKAALEDSGIEFREEYVAWNDYSEEGGYESGNILHQLRDRPTAICASNDQQAIGCWKAFRDLGDETALTGLDNLNISKIIGITSFDMKEGKIGEAAAKILLEQLHSDKIQHKDMYFVPELIIRESSIGKKRDV